MWGFLGIGRFISVLCQIGFESLDKFTPCQHNAPPAACALEPDIRAQACDDPFVGATGVLLAQAQAVVETKVGQHEWASIQ